MKKYFFILIILYCSVASAQNILLNPSFEVWLDTLGVRIPFGWYTSEVGDSGTAVRVTDPHSGIYAMQLNGSDTMAYAITLSISFPARHYCFSGWCKSEAIIAGTFIITWLKLSQQPVTDPVIIPIYRSTSWRQYAQTLECPDSTVLVNVNIVTLPYISITVDDVTLTDTILSDIEEQLFETKSNAIRIYPNPCKNQAQILLPGDINQPNKIDIYNISGKLVKNINQVGRERVNLDTRNFAEGIYFLKVIRNKETTVHKLIVQR